MIGTAVVLMILVFTTVAANTKYAQYAVASASAVATDARLAAEVARYNGRRGGLIYYRRNGIACGDYRGFARIVRYA